MSLFSSAEYSSCKLNLRVGLESIYWPSFALFIESSAISISILALSLPPTFHFEI